MRNYRITKWCRIESCSHGEVFWNIVNLHKYPILKNYTHITIDLSKRSIVLYRQFIKNNFGLNVRMKI